MPYSASSGRRVSEYRKAFFHAGNSFSPGGLNQSTITQLLGDTTSISQLKHLRGVVTIGPTQSAVSGSPATARGLLCLVRWPIAEALVWNELNIDDSALLHPVPWSVIQYPTQIYYEYEAITLSERERLYFVVWPAYSSEGFTTETSMLYNIRKTKV